MNVEILKSCGINYDKGLARFMGDGEFYQTALEMFLNIKDFENARAALASQDYRALFDAVHSLKGICGNLDMTDCYRLTCELTEMLRGGLSPNAPLDETFCALEAAYTKIREGIAAARA